ncbi:hypothetical protein SKAU_G00251180 [Synaphobranchus kaupii]|uniref:Uncharacterized protein n=1 Tax=Synaphobranchus kaupii TaxID=118154 RepID=A0A9Q1IRM1_SYNKA|nr:hypothetical protein SKAU_G00251180 [Synaphobranchus kaupii]
MVSCGKREFPRASKGAERTRGALSTSTETNSAAGTVSAGRGWRPFPVLPRLGLLAESLLAGLTGNATPARMLCPGTSPHSSSLSSSSSSITFFIIIIARPPLVSSDTADLRQIPFPHPRRWGEHPVQQTAGTLLCGHTCVGQRELAACLPAG